MTHGLLPYVMRDVVPHYWRWGTASMISSVNALHDALLHEAADDEGVQEQADVLLPEQLHQLVLHHLRSQGMHLEIDHLGARFVQGRVDLFVSEPLSDFPIDAVVEGRRRDDESSGDEAAEKPIAFHQQNARAVSRGAGRRGHPGKAPTAHQHVHVRRDRDLPFRLHNPAHRLLQRPSGPAGPRDPAPSPAG
jgi:hypothetical protein